MTDLFVGRWILDSEQCQYTVGNPPKRGIYTIIEEGHQRLRFDIVWTAADDCEHELSFSGIIDGEEYPYHDSEVVDTVTIIQQHPRQLDTIAKKDGQVINHARRILSEDGQVMKVTQSILTPNGMLDNIAVYRRDD